MKDTLDKAVVEQAQREAFARVRRLVDQFAAESDRAAVVLSAAILDELLRELLMKALHPPANKTEDLLDNDGPLDSFSARIKLAQRLGLIDPNDFRRLNLIRRLRNGCAHDPEHAVLCQSPLSDRIRELGKSCESPDGQIEFYETIVAEHAGTPASEYRGMFLGAAGLVLIHLTCYLVTCRRAMCD